MQKLTIEDVVAEFNHPVTLNEHGCWLWLGPTDKYGYAKHGGGFVYLWTLRKSGKPSPCGMDTCHKCPNKSCINPDHFYVGTHLQNMNDDNRLPMGPKGKLTQEQIAELNTMLLRNIPKGIIAYHFGVSPQWISKFLRGEFSYAKPL